IRNGRLGDRAARTQHESHSTIDRAFPCSGRSLRPATQSTDSAWLLFSPRRGRPGSAGSRGAGGTAGRRGGATEGATAPETSAAARPTAPLYRALVGRTGETSPPSPEAAGLTAEVWPRQASCSSLRAVAITLKVQLGPEVEIDPGSEDER